jgi:hypothetical protein
MSSFCLHNRICKVGALIAATLILPALAYAGHDNGWGNGGRNNGKGNNDEGNGKGNGGGDKHIVGFPEANAGWVLVPFFGAVLLFSSQQFFRAKADQKGAAPSRLEGDFWRQNFCGNLLML